MENIHGLNGILTYFCGAFYSEETSNESDISFTNNKSTKEYILLVFLKFYQMPNNRVFPKADHSANVDRIALVEYTIGSVVESNFC